MLFKIDVVFQTDGGHTVALVIHHIYGTGSLVGHGKRWRGGGLFFNCGIQGVVAEGERDVVVRILCQAVLTLVQLCGPLRNGLIETTLLVTRETVALNTAIKKEGKSRCQRFCGSRHYNAY